MHSDQERMRHMPPCIIVVPRPGGDDDVRGTEKSGPIFSCTLLHYLFGGMPLNTAEYLTKRGWRGHGTPLDGERGRGLKKPLLIPKKRSMSGIGQDRDRAVEWWDDVFAVRTRATNETRQAPKLSL